MNFKAIICITAFFVVATVHGQTKKFDTTVKFGDKGYRVTCSNKNPDKNDVNVSPINLKVTSQNPTFSVNGKVTKAITDDFNDDGRPDLVLCVFSGADMQQGSVVAISYTADNSFEAIYFPEIYLDSKVREGYKGHDEFSALTGTLLRKFPIYLSADTDKPTGGTRTIQYKAMQDNGHLTFKVLRWYDVP
ncbi:MAG: hypothetical protein JO072_10410 [Parafilimonas sp.]|nr:hypothetical protein [Parafilimonas sp.]